MIVLLHKTFATSRNLLETAEFKISRCFLFTQNSYFNLMLSICLTIHR